MFYYKQVIDNQIVSVEAKNRKSKSPNFVNAIQEEYDEFIGSLPVVEPEPVRDLETEIDELRDELKEIKTTLKKV